MSSNRIRTYKKGRMTYYSASSSTLPRTHNNPINGLGPGSRSAKTPKRPGSPHLHELAQQMDVVASVSHPPTSGKHVNLSGVWRDCNLRPASVRPCIAKRSSRFRWSFCSAAALWPVQELPFWTSDDSRTLPRRLGRALDHVRDSPSIRPPEWEMDIMR